MITEEFLLKNERIGWVALVVSILLAISLLHFASSDSSNYLEWGFLVGWAFGLTAAFRGLRYKLRRQNKS